jgi:hypothetical protein
LLWLTDRIFVERAHGWWEPYVPLLHGQPAISFNHRSGQHKVSIPDKGPFVSPVFQGRVGQFKACQKFWRASRLVSLFFLSIYCHSSYAGIRLDTRDIVADSGAYTHGLALCQKVDIERASFLTSDVNVMCVS